MALSVALPIWDSDLMALLNEAPESQVFNPSVDATESPLPLNSSSPLVFLSPTENYTNFDRNDTIVTSRVPNTGPFEGRSWYDDLEYDRSIVNASDDGVVLLVGLFNLLAIVVYAGQQIVSGSTARSDRRIVYWQVQKVLDELVLRVHSSDTASNLLSRALRFSTDEPSGRGRSSGEVSQIVNDLLLQDRDPRQIINHLNNFKTRLIADISASPFSMTGPRIDPRVYEPLKALYNKVIEPIKGERSYSLSLVQEVKEIVRTLKTMNLTEVQGVLRTISQLGKIKNHYDVVSVLRRVVPSQVTTRHGTETIFKLPKLEESRRRRRLKRSKGGEAARNVRYRRPRYSPAIMRYKARKLGKLLKRPRVGSEPVEDTTSTPPSKRLSKRRGMVDTLLHDEDAASSPPNWADGWFSLLTQASPVALDLITIYTRAKVRPSCLKALLCKANDNWKETSTFQAAFAPFLSVIASWAMEDKAPHSLGDSLIALRAGWMGKTCQDLYPECPLNTEIHPLAEQTLNFFGKMRERETKQRKKSESRPFSKSGAEGDNLLQESNLSPAIARPPPTRKSTSASTTSTSTTPSTTTTTTATTTPSTTPATSTTSATTTTPTPAPQAPYDRYDSPYYSGADSDGALHSGSVSGMALQDRPLSKHQADPPTSSSLIEALMPPSHIRGRPPSKPDQQPLYKVPSTLGQTPGLSSQSQDPESYDLKKRPRDDPARRSEYPTKFINNEIPKYAPSWSSERRRPTTSKWHSGRRPPPTSYVRHSDYFAYMASQSPAYVKEKNRSIPYPKASSSGEGVPTHQRFPQKRKLVRKKYKYGLRRGLPASNVDGHGPLTEATPSDTRASSNRKGTTFQLRHQPLDRNAAAGHPDLRATTYKPPSTKNPLEGKYVAQFGPKDAITDPLRNDLLYQYIRDRHI